MPCRQAISRRWARRSSPDATSRRAMATAVPLVAVINASMAAKYFGRENAIGRRLTMGEGRESRSVEVIGVVRDSVYQELQEEPRRIVYVPYMQTPNVLQASSLYAESTDGGSRINR